jgi:hypothetical protein
VRRFDEKPGARAGYVIVPLRGEFDVGTRDGLRALVAPAASGSWIIADLAEVAFMDCASLRELAAFRARARRAGGVLPEGLQQGHLERPGASRSHWHVRFHHHVQRIPIRRA